MHMLCGVARRAAAAASLLVVRRASLGEVESARVLQLVRLALLFSPKPHSSPTIPTLRRTTTFLTAARTRPDKLAAIVFCRRTTTFLTYSGRRSQDLKDFTRRSLDRLAAAAGNRCWQRLRVGQRCRVCWCESVCHAAARVCRALDRTAAAGPAGSRSRL